MRLRSLCKRILKVVVPFTDLLLLFRGPGPPHPERVLLVRLDAIGDFVLWLDAARAIVSHYRSQGKRATLVANESWAKWATDLGIFDDVIPLARDAFSTDPLYRYKLGRAIRALNSSIAIEPTYSREWSFGDAIIRLAGASERIGFAGDLVHMESWQKWLSDRWYTRLISSESAASMELIRNADFVRSLIDVNFLAKIPDLGSQSALQPNGALAAAIPVARAYYVLFPGASWNGKQWPVASFVETAQRLYKATKWHAVVCGGAADQKVAQHLCERASVPIINWVGNTDLPQLTTILAAARLLLTNDTSAAHIAAALGVPTVCLLGGGHYGRFMPYKVEQITKPLRLIPVIHPMPCFGCNWKCIYKRSHDSPVPCIEGISTEAVWSAIGKVLHLQV